MPGQVYIEGLDQLLRNLSRKSAEVKREAFKGLEAAGQEVVNDAKENLRNNRSVITGLLRASGHVQKVNAENIDAGFFDTQNRQSGYAYFVEYGRRAGRMPPPDELAQWAYKKFQLHDRKLARQAGWAMAVKIAREGTAPHPFFIPALEKNKSRIVQIIQDAINRTTR